MQNKLVGYHESKPLLKPFRSYFFHLEITSIGFIHTQITATALRRPMIPSASEGLELQIPGQRAKPQKIMPQKVGPVSP
jgi:hypothetical protein